MGELLERIPIERCWELTSKILSAFFVIRGEKIIAPVMGKGEGIISHIWGAERWADINVKIFSDGGKQLIPWVKKMFNIPVEDAIGAAKLIIVAATLLCGPELEFEIVEETPERVVVRWHKCVWTERYKEFEVDPAFIPCPKGHKVMWNEGLKLIDPKLSDKLTKAMPWGDPYCEDVYEFKCE
jgi:hypothetical protein